MGNSRKLLPLLYKYIKIFNKRKMVRFMQNEIVYGIKKYILGGRAKFSIIQISNGTTIKEDYEVRTSQNNRNMYFCILESWVMVKCHIMVTFLITMTRYYFINLKHLS